MKSGQRLRVIDDEPGVTRAGRPGRKPPFRKGAIVTCKSAAGEGPDADIELREHRGYWRAHRFAREA